MTTATLDDFELGERLGSGSTWKANWPNQDEVVVIKELTLGRITDWKELELFEREAAVLRDLDHACIPAVRASFQHGGDDPSLYLVTDFVEGDALNVSRQLPATEVREVVEQVLDILSYLQRFRPPVLHRDIKPGNLIRRPDGSIALVDFGAVQVDTYDTMGGTTIVGTPGYMAPEQLIGRAVPASDLYSLGVTAIALLTSTSPVELPMDRMKLSWRDRVSGDAAFFDLIDRMIEPRAHDRLANADRALEQLHLGEAAPLIARRSRPALLESAGAVEIQRSADALLLRLPAKYRYGAPPLVFLGVCLILVFGGMGLAYLAGWSASNRDLVYWVTSFFALFITTVALRPDGRKAQLVLRPDGYELRSKQTRWETLQGGLDQIELVESQTGLGVKTDQGTYELGRCERIDRERAEYQIARFVRDYTDSDPTTG